MRIRVLYFAGSREMASTKGEAMELPDGSTVRELAGRLVGAHPRLRQLGGAVRYAVNLRVADEGDRLADGDEVGVLPPVAGG